jgi:membrane-bound lytic murein transglycosylase D
MIRTKSNGIAYTIIFSLLLICPIFGCAQNSTAIKKTTHLAQKTTPAAEVTKQTVKPQYQLAKADIEENDNNEENKIINSDDASPADNGVSEDKQVIMEKALELLETADKLWEKGDIEGTLNTLDEAYSLILDANGDVTVAQEKDDLRLLISRRILAVYSSKKAVVNGKNSEIPLIMNADVEKEIRSFQGPERDNFIAAYQRSNLYRNTILKELKKAGIPEEFLWLPLVESFFKVNAYSRARALGLWQFIPSTGYKFGLDRNDWIDERMDVQKSTRAAIAYLTELHGMFGDWLTALAAYNCGEGRVLRVISRQHINYLDGFWDLYRQLPNETARYVPRFLATLHIVKNPQKYGFDLKDGDKPVECETVKVNKIMKIKDIAEKIEVSEDVLHTLNPELRLQMTPDREYNLRLPEKSLDKFKLVYNDIPQSEKPRVTSVRTASLKHRVRRGETISSIAQKYDVSVASIRSRNKLSAKSTLAPGRKLIIPVTRSERYAAAKSSPKNSVKEIASSGKYKVKKGETLSMLSKRFSVSVDQLKSANNLKKGKIIAGQILTIPSKKVKADADVDDVKSKKTVKSTKSTKSTQSAQSDPKDKIGKKVLSTTDVDELGTNKYIVTKNDSLHSIAKKNKINVATLMELNKISVKDKLSPGQILIIK